MVSRCVLPEAHGCLTAGVYSLPLARARLRGNVHVSARKSLAEAGGQSEAVRLLAGALRSHLHSRSGSGSRARPSPAAG